MRNLKKLFTKLLNQRFGVIFGLAIGIIVTSCIGYGVNSIQSSSVSYTRDGTTVSVKQALDEVINKSLTRIEFLEKWLSSNTGLSLEQIKNNTEFNYLADVVSVGDYVAYDAGSWTETKAKPTSQGQFGGYTKDQNKANSVSWCDNSQYTTTLKGWRVLSIDTSTKTVTLVHAGQSECYYHASGGYSNISVTNLNNRATSEYLNSDYAISAHIMTYDDSYAITGSEDNTTNSLRTTGDTYWLATAYNNEKLRGGGLNGNIGHTFNYSEGVRPVVVLKANILTTGKGADKVGQKAWTLVKP